MLTFIQATNYTKGRSVPIRFVVIHDMEEPQGVSTAEDVANWFANQAPGDNGTSAHCSVDENSIVDSVHATDTAWAVPSANSDGLSIEHAGFARDSAAAWDSKANIAMLEISAARSAHYSVKYGIPVVHLSKAEIQSGAKGFVGHVDITNALNGGVGHQDPGPNFPWDHYLTRVKVHILAQNPPVKPVVVKPIKLKALRRKTNRNVIGTTKELLERSTTKDELTLADKAELGKLIDAANAALAVKEGV